MRTNVIAPKQTVVGKCCVGVGFQKPIHALTQDNIVLVGDTNDVSYRIFGMGAGWELQFRLPTDTTGQFTVSLVGWVDVPRKQVADDGEITTITEQVAIKERPPVSVAYDTHRAVDAEFGDVIRKDKRVLCFPIKLSDAVVGFPRKSLSVFFSSGKGRVVQLTGSGTDYELLIQPPRTGGTLTITPAQSVEKMNGIVLPIAFDAIEMDYEGVG